MTIGTFWTLEMKTYKAILQWSQPNTELDIYVKFGEMGLLSILNYINSVH